MNIVVSHPTGNRNVRAILDGFSNAGILSEFNTTIAVDLESYWLRFLPKSLRLQLERRSFPLRKEKIHTRPWREFARMASPYFGLRSFVNHEEGWACIDRVYQALDAAVAKGLEHSVKPQIDAVYAYEDGAHETFVKAKSLGLKCIYDLPIAYWKTGRTLINEESERLPAWAITLGGGLSDSTAKLERKDRELELADMIVTPSEFVADSLPAFTNKKKIIVSHFGSPIVNNRRVGRINHHRPLRVLFVGSMGQRKGLGDLFQAIRLLKGNNIELVVMGGLLAPLEFYQTQLPDFIYEPGRPNNKVLELMRSCDVFCLPSIVEGRALVMQEAMSQGLPLIITPNTGGSDLIIEGKTGFIVPIRSPHEIAEKLNWFVENREAIPDMGRLAQLHAANYTWEAYGQRVIRYISELLN